MATTVVENIPGTTANVPTGAYYVIEDRVFTAGEALTEGLHVEIDDSGTVPYDAGVVIKGGVASKTFMGITMHAAAAGENIRCLKRGLHPNVATTDTDVSGELYATLGAAGECTGAAAPVDNITIGRFVMTGGSTGAHPLGDGFGAAWIGDIPGGTT